MKASFNYLALAVLFDASIMGSAAPVTQTQLAGSYAPVMQTSPDYTSTGAGPAYYGAGSGQSAGAAAQPTSSYGAGAVASGQGSAYSGAASGQGPFYNGAIPVSPPGTATSGPAPTASSGTSAAPQATETSHLTILEKSGVVALGIGALVAGRKVFQRLRGTATSKIRL